jgi:hypothetical protein
MKARELTLGMNGFRAEQDLLGNESRVNGLFGAIVGLLNAWIEQKAQQI